jgi:prevent-host-death family protein
MISITISDFRSNLLKYLNLANEGKELVITSKGKELATIIAPKTEQEIARQKLKEMSKNIVLGDIISPIDVEWDALK